MAMAVFLFMAHATAKGAVHSSADLQRVVDQAYTKYKDLKEGKNADYIPILTTVPSDLFGVVIVTRDGNYFASVSQTRFGEKGLKPLQSETSAGGRCFTLC